MVMYLLVEVVWLFITINYHNHHFWPSCQNLQLKLLLWSSKVYKDCILPSSSSSSSSLGKVSYKKKIWRNCTNWRFKCFFPNVAHTHPNILLRWSIIHCFFLPQIHLIQIFPSQPSNWYSGGQKVKSNWNWENFTTKKSETQGVIRAFTAKFLKAVYVKMIILVAV